ncbi:MAG: HlyC/CorC family transporter, partial [candidate division NC10 bacterium]|nr:HlyC/CorC family transporter [candidate division NC10 bacterium]
MSEWGLPALLLAMGAFLQAFFAGCELALAASPLPGLRRRAASGSRGARQAVAFLEAPERFLTATLVGNTAALVLSGTGAALLGSRLGGVPGAAVAVLLLGPVLTVVADLVPRTLCQDRAERVAPLLAPALTAATRALFPLTALARRGAAALLTVLRIERSGRSPFLSREEIRVLLGQGERGAAAGRARGLIDRVFAFGERTVREAMIPLVDVVALPEEATVADAVAIVEAYPFARIPLYEDRVDRLTGFLHTLDLLGAEASAPLRPLLRPAPYVPESPRLDDLLRDLQRARTQMAMVVDEYGGVVGIVTMEDLLEELVGEIEDEDDDAIPAIRRLPDGAWLVDARIEVERLNEETGLQVPKGEYETLAGYLLALLQKIPEPGEEITAEGIHFLVTEADRRSILKVKIRRASPRR